MNDVVAHAGMLDADAPRHLRAADTALRYRHTALSFLERGALMHPQWTAVVDEHGTRSYGQLFEMSRRVATALTACVPHALETGTAQPVAVYMEKGADMLAACFGALMAGGFYVPLDPSLPCDRVRGIAAQLGDPPIIASQETIAAARGTFSAARVLAVEDLLAHAVDDALLAARAGAIVDTDPAYVLFTSGSTGAPKGVAVSHRAILAFIGTFVATFGITADDVLGNQAPFDFDVSVKDIYGALAAGATIAVLPRRLFSEPAALVDALAAHGVTVMVWAAAALCLLSALHGLEHRDLPQVRLVMFSGEVMPMKHLRRWMERLPRARFVNLYGPTEVTCNCLYHVVERGRAYEEGLPLGVPFTNRRVLVLDSAGAPVTQPGDTGEICVGGSALALGYWGDRERTRAAFVQNPCNAALPETIYRTGDLARIGADGELYFSGRVDNQIKHLGHRIELEEIDAAFERVPGVERCRCVYVERRQQIVAFYEGTAAAGTMRHAVAHVLPAPWVPARIEHVEAMPLTKNGKVDRAALRDLASAPRAVRHEALPVRS